MRPQSEYLSTVFKTNLKQLRLNAHLTKTQAANNIGVSPGHYHNLENINEIRSPSFVTIEKITAYYNIDASKLFEDNTKK